MKLDVKTLAFILGLTFFVQFIAVFVQYRVNRTCRGIGWWLAGSAAMATAFMLMPLVTVKSLVVFAMFANPLLVLGHVFLYVGVCRFLGQKVSRWLTSATYGIFGVLYYYFIFFHNDIRARTIVMSTAAAIMPLAAAYNLIFRKDERIAATAHFTAAIFLVHGCFMAVRALWAVMTPPVHAYADMGPIFVISFIVPAITGTLWTFGCILMVNQRLNVENHDEKEFLQRAEAALRESEETYRSILNASPDDITITDLEGRILMVSPAANKMFGYPAGAEEGKHILDFVVPGDQARARSNLILLFQGGAQETHEYRGMRKDRSELDIEVNSGIVRGIDGEPAKLVFMVRDITGRKRTEAENAALEVRNRQLQKTESLGRMAGAIAHHFNNRLQSVMSNLELLGALPRGADLEAGLTRARLATEGAAEVSRLMLAYLGQTSQEQEPRYLAELCRSGLVAIQGTLPDSVALDLDFPFPGPVIRANANQIRQVLESLVSNAWEAMGVAGGRIRVGLTTVPAADIPGVQRFPLDWQPREAEYACLEVADDGCGIAGAALENLFDPFFSTKFTGRGLGLSVLLGMVQAHGGAVTVASRPGQGSVFRVHFPLCTGAASHAPAAALPAPAPEPGGTVLLVDDDPSLLMSTGAMIELMGYTLATAGDGIEAVEVFQRHRGEIRCVITDLTMPRMDGWETLAALRQLEPGLPVILASGYDQGQAMAGTHPEQPQAFLGKPFGRKQLSAALGRAVQGRI
jgi:PAS domain S-box-containing protein